MNLATKTEQEDTLKEEKRIILGRIARHNDTENELKKKITEHERLYK